MHRLATQFLLLALVGMLTPAQVHAEEIRRKTFRATDTVQFTQDADPDTQKLLDELRFDRQTFDVQARTLPAEPQQPDARVTFPSPRPGGDPAVDTVVLDWYVARNANGQVLQAPAILIVHELDGGMRFSKPIARQFAAQGIHGFLMHVPGFGLRWSPNIQRNPQSFVQRGQQGILDARRARDVIAVLPHVEGGRVQIQGTSMGGFITACAAAIDGAFERAYICLAGGDIERTLRDSGGESMFVWPILHREGLRKQDLGAGQLRGIEPLRLAHRLPRDRVWLVSASEDNLILPRSTIALAKAANLPQENHIWIAGNHFTCLVHIPQVIQMIVANTRVQLGDQAVVTPTNVANHHTP